MDTFFVADSLFETIPEEQRVESRKEFIAEFKALPWDIEGAPGLITQTEQAKTGLFAWFGDMSLEATRYGSIYQVRASEVIKEVAKKKKEVVKDAAVAVAVATPVSAVKMEEVRVVGNWTGTGEAEFRAAGLRLYEGLHKKIIYIVPHGVPFAMPKENQTTDSFIVLFWSTPKLPGLTELERSEITQSKAWGFSVGTVSESFPSTETGYQIISPEGQCVAEYFHNRCLYIHYDMVHGKEGTSTEHNPDDVNIFNKIIDEVLDEIRIQTLSPEDRRKVEDERKNKQLEILQKQFSSVCLEGKKNNVGRLEGELEQNKENIRQTSTSLTQLIRREGELTRTLEITRAIEDSQAFTTMCAREIASILKTKQVKKLSIKDKVIHVWTYPIKALNPRNKLYHDIG
jgi:hypothetical protein